MPIVPPFNTKQGMLNVVFHLQEAGAAANSSEEFGRSIQVGRHGEAARDIVALLPATRRAPMAAGAESAESSSSTEQIRLAKARKLIDSQFEMAIGETVVVGTSKIGGDKGLVVLLTSVAGGK